MKLLNVNNQQFQADKIIKTTTDIIGQDSNGNEIFAFRGISDFAGFTLEEGQTFDVEENLTETLSKEMATMKIDNMKKDTTMTSALKTIADLRVEVMNLKGGKV